MKENFFTVNELAKHFRLNQKNIYRRLWAKGIPAFKEWLKKVVEG